MKRVLSKLIEWEKIKNKRTKKQTEKYLRLVAHN